MNVGDRVRFRMSGYRPDRYGYWTATGIVVGWDGRGWLVQKIGVPDSVHACEKNSSVVRVEADNIEKEVGE